MKRGIVIRRPTEDELRRQATLKHSRVAVCTFCEEWVYGPYVDLQYFQDSHQCPKHESLSARVAKPKPGPPKKKMRTVSGGLPTLGKKRR